ncbi:phospholipase D-like domain-containing protein [Streptomyces sp. WAC05374]|uniref:phospholipase D-like domain-containing protein n=1 Tax=Streptomyces sp. WAC05374 TaxID=2487420 RepID=UPI001F19360A|nr:phospholipase D-like domain-containing protein [Streptomyces sp. WAC05374]
MKKINLGLTATTTAAVLALLNITAPVPALADDSALPPQAAVAEATMKTGVVWNDPTGDAARQYAIRDHLVKLIDGATAGSDIKISAYVLGGRNEPDGTNKLRDSLVNAHNRGVNVQLIVDSESSRYWESASVFTHLATQLAKATGKNNVSWLRMCPFTPRDLSNPADTDVDSQACLAKDPDPDDDWGGVNHNKFYLFSETTGTGTEPVKNVVVQTSANMTSWDSEYAWNDALRVVGNQALYDAYTKYFDLQAAAQADRSKVVSDVPLDTQAGRAKAYFFPRAEDVIVNILKTVDNPVPGQTLPCRGNSAGIGTEGRHTVVRVAIHGITRPEVADALVALHNAGCYVDVVYRTLSDDVRSKLINSGVTLHQLHSEERSETLKSTHSKYLLIEGTYNGKIDQKIVFTGSHPYTKSALTTNDEALLKWDDSAVGDVSHTASVYTSYRYNFWAQRAAADAQPQPQP